MSPWSPRTVDTSLEARPVAWRRLESKRALDLTQSALPEYHNMMSTEPTSSSHVVSLKKSSRWV